MNTSRPFDQHEIPSLKVLRQKPYGRFWVRKMPDLVRVKAGVRSPLGDVARHGSHGDEKVCTTSGESATHPEVKCF